jgi:hypothetical protein
MIRTLTLVSVLALIAGVAMGFFIASAAERTAAPTQVSSADRIFDAKVQAYVDGFGLAPADAAEIRSTLLEYDQRIADVFRRLHQQHQDEFKALVERANARIGAVLARYPHAAKGK